MPRKKKRPRLNSNASSVQGSDDLCFNDEFARKYESQKRREILASHPVAALEGDSEDSDQSSEEEEDEFAELLTKKIDRRIRATLQALQAKDPRIYQKDVKFFENSDNEENSSKCDDVDAGESVPENSEQDDSESSGDENVDSDDEPVAGWDAVVSATEEKAKLTLKDYVRENLMKDGRLSDSEIDEGVAPVPKRSLASAKNPKRVSFAVDLSRGNLEKCDKKFGEDPDCENTMSDSRSTAVVSERKLHIDGGGDDRTEEADENEDDCDGDFFTKKERSQSEIEEEEQNFERFLTGQSKRGASKSGDALLLHSYLENETPDEKERFLRDFVLNNGWLDKSGSTAPQANDYRIEVDDTDVSKAVVLQERNPDPADAVLERDGHDSDFEDKVEEFEHKYNFRFEDPDGTEVVSHARSIEGSLRRPDERRKLARQARKSRKQHEKLVKSEEIKQLKNLKQREIEARLIALEEAAGAGANFKDFDLDADFDPEELSRQMEKHFGDDYYAYVDTDMRALEDEGVLVATEALARGRSARGGVKEGSADAEQNDINDSLRDNVDRLVEEYYNLDYEDIIEGTAVRFNYKKVDPETFGLDVNQVLEEDDSKLNREASLKYLAPYRPKKSIPFRIRTRRKHKTAEHRPNQANPAEKHERKSLNSSSEIDAQSRHWQAKSWSRSGRGPYYAGHSSAADDVEDSTTDIRAERTTRAKARKGPSNSTSRLSTRNQSNVDGAQTDGYQRSDDIARNTDSVVAGTDMDTRTSKPESKFTRKRRKAKSRDNRATLPDLVASRKSAYGID